MRASYRLIQVQVDPFIQNRTTIGAMVFQEGENPRVVLVETLPCDECLGGTRCAIGVKRLQLRIMRTEDEESMGQISPYLLVLDAQEIPVGGPDLVEWVRSLINPRKTFCDKDNS